VLSSGMAHNVSDSMAVLTNLVPGRRRGSSGVCPGAVSRVVAPESLPGRRPYADSRAWLMGIRSCTEAGVATSYRLGFPQCWG
jgi:hypothetical protein